jgi:ATPase subunit of ABC transporter with duplicated ATPase domains
MGSIGLRNLGAIAGAPLFSDLNLTIQDGDRVGLVAGNGRGKTTLLRMLAGLAEPASGEIVRSRGLSIGYVEQDIPPQLLDLPLRAAVSDALPAGQRATEVWRAEIALDGFETPDELRERPIRALSGGWQRLMLIARVWVADPDALLLDEPTNHLDLGKILLLENWLNGIAAGIPAVIASHDRAFLDATTNRTLFLRPEGSRFFALPFSAARQALDETDAADAAKLDRDLKAARQLRQQAAKLTNIGINSGSDLLTKKAKQLKDRAARVEAAARPPHRERSGEISLSNSGTHARLLVTLDDVPVTTPDGRALFRTGRLHIFQGDRIVLLGSNGAGKSQFVRLLESAITAPGSIPGIKVTPSLVLGFIDQEMSQLPARATPEDIIGRFGSGDARTHALLAGAGFAVEKQARPVAELSPGQRARLGLLALRLAEPNFYLMDEPTNHVDIPGREALEAEILKHGATAVLVSHDRRFVRDVGSRYLRIVGRKLVESEGPEDFFANMAREAAM